MKNNDSLKIATQSKKGLRLIVNDKIWEWIQY